MAYGLHCTSVRFCFGTKVLCLLKPPTFKPYWLRRTSLPSPLSDYKITRTTEINEKWENWLRHTTSFSQKQNKTKHFFLLFFLQVCFFTNKGNNIFWCQKEGTCVQWRLGGSCSLSICKKCYLWYVNSNSGCSVPAPSDRMGSRNRVTLCSTEQLRSLVSTACISITGMWDIVALTAQRVLKAFMHIKDWTVWLFFLGVI